MASTQGKLQAIEISDMQKRASAYGVRMTLEAIARRWIKKYHRNWREAYKKLGRPPLFDEYRNFH